MKRIAVIAASTGREAIRNKILYSILLFAAFVVTLSALVGAATIRDQLNFAKDFSLLSISLFGVGIAVVLGVNLLHKELGKQTILNLLSKPVSRWEFLLGKYLGLLGTLSLIVSLMCVALLVLLIPLQGAIDYGVLLASMTILFELMVIIAAALFFSSIVVTPTLAGLFTVATFIAGRSALYLLYFSRNPHQPDSLRTAARTLYWLLPHLHRFNISDQVIYGNYFDPVYFGAIFVYALGYSALLIVLSIVFFSRREFS